MMRRLIAAALLVITGAAPAIAQSDDQPQPRYNLTKILIGGGAVALGTIIAAKSSETTTVSSAVGSSTTSTFSKSQLITGLSIAGVGGIVLWNGLQARHAEAPSTRVGVAVGGTTHAVLVQRTW